ncbi:hypothetical protein DRE_01547 [Drechslerella stenobrocha 248]|uniref:Uncharacterized protein n=1 Tax=Drechslerella stenobrocha 248 TaxID=1043628 RepID=W7I4J6_9PEZI|nr:hypothetical protein DRE_01547 [Drechslerella stenobrocha 248]
MPGLSDEEKVKRIEAYEEQLRQDKNFAQNSADQIKGQALVDCNWSELFSTAPFAISSMGSCFIVSSYPYASSTRITKSPQQVGLKWESLRGNLVEIAALGDRAFSTAHTKLNAINLGASATKNQASGPNSTLTCRRTRPDAVKATSMYLGQIKRSTESSYSNAKDVDAVFQTWLDYVCSFHAACEDTKSAAERSKTKNQAEIIERTKRIEGQGQLVADAQKQTKVMEDSLKVAVDKFKQAADSFPSGWSLVGQDSVRMLVGTIPSAVNIAVTTGIGSLTGNPTAAFGAVGAEALKGATEVTGQVVGIVQQQLEAKKEAAVQPLFIQNIHYVMIAFNILKGVIDNAAEGKMMADAPLLLKNGVVLAMEDLEKTLTAGQKGSGVPALDKRLAEIVAAGLKIGKELEAEVAKDTKATVASAKVIEIAKKLQPEFVKQRNEALSLQTVAASVPGNNVNPPPLETQKLTKEQVENNKWVLQSATDRLTITQKGLNGSQAEYNKSTQHLAELTKELIDVQASLAKLESETVTLDEVQKVLVNCVGLIASMKQTISGLAQFFQNMSETVGVLINVIVADLINIGEGANQSKADAGDLGNVISILGHYSLFSDISSMWVKLSKDHLKPGLALASGLGGFVGTADTNKPILSATQKQMAEKNKLLHDWSDKASAAVKKMVEDAEKEAKAAIDTRSNQNAALVSALMPSEESRKAIEAGYTINKTAQKALEAANTVAPLGIRTENVQA